MPNRFAKTRPTTQQWRFWIDRGGTFTDVIAAAPDGSLITRKLLSENAQLYADAASHAVAAIVGEHAGAQIEEVRIGTTVATNALLERKGAKTALLITEGLRDALEIGTQHRPNLFALNVTRPRPLYSTVYGIPERVSADGYIITPLDTDAVKAALQQAKTEGCTAIVICFLHGARHRGHEAAARTIAASFGFATVVASHEASSRHKLVPRGHTASADAYLTPILTDYVRRVEGSLNAQHILFMKSDGGVTPARTFRGKDAVLSGPAGGIVGAVEVAKAHGFKKVIAFDMGGTSTDVAHYDARYDQAEMPEIAGVGLDVPMLDIHTIAAGGGSILRYGDGRFQVGPQSAGAQPGPCAYGRGGPLTITDCHVLLGRLQPHAFPKIFGQNGNQALDKTRVVALFEQLRDEIDPSLTLEAVATGFLDVACEQMARAVKKITQERGIDPKDYVLVAFGGAGGQCACRVAERIGVKTVLIHPLAGLLSALGIGLTARTARASEAIDSPLDAALLKQAAAKLTQQVEAQLPGAALRFDVDIRQRGSDMTLTVPMASRAEMAQVFIDMHTARFGFEPEGQLHVDSLHCQGEVPAKSLDQYQTSTAASAHISERIDGYFGPCHGSATLADAQAIETIDGPAVLLSDGSTTVVEPGWTATRQASGALVLKDVQKSNQVAAAAQTLDPIQLEIFHHRFMAIAEQMGAVLERTAHSINIKERLDFSCALFDGQGQLVANAPHMPVHLGSMGETVAALIKRDVDWQPGTAFAHNDPYEGGTHLPDVTVVMPVFQAGSAAPFAFVASRGHHADIGGVTPGSMPANSSHIDEEGCVFSATQILRRGKIDKAAILNVLTRGAHPARKIDTNLADLRAQIAACQTGANAMLALAQHVGPAMVTRYMGYIQDNAQAVVTRLIAKLESGAAQCMLEDIGPLCISITCSADKRAATIDFTGTGDQGAHNFNAPLAVTKAAVLYCLRCLVDEDIPLNAGCLRPIKLIVPEGSLLNPRAPAAVVAGNVETSQAVTNLLFEALGARAGSQGTMNNVIFGNQTHQYYETLGGGTGAGPGFDGEHAIHSDMTNSRLTDPEVLETRLPIQVLQMTIRDGSGGAGRQRGGGGLVREILFLEEMDLCILSSHRAKGPRGLDGGQPGLPGCNTLLRGGKETALPARASVAVKPGDAIRIETPGGGGYGAPKHKRP